MKKDWFQEWGWIYRPMAWEGWISAVVAILFCAQVFAAVDRHSHSASDTLYGVFPDWVPAQGVLDWVAGKTSRKAS